MTGEVSAEEYFGCHEQIIDEDYIEIGELNAPEEAARTLSEDLADRGYLERLETGEYDATGFDESSHIEYAEETDLLLNPVGDAEKQVLVYLEEENGADIADIAAGLGKEFRQAKQAVHSLWDKHMVVSGPEFEFESDPEAL